MILSFTAISGYLTRATPTASSKISATTQYNLLAAVALGLMILSTGSLITNHAYIRIGSASQFGLGVQKDAFPVAAANILSRADFPTKILNIAHDGGYIALQNPSCKVFCDTRTSFYGNEFYQTLNRALLGQPGAWNKIRSEWSPHAVVLNGCWPDAGALAKRLLASRAWKLVYFDGSTIIMVADLPEYATLINNPEIQQAGLKVLEKARRDYLEQSKGLVKAGNSSRLIGAGNIYYELNRLLEAEAVYTALTDNSPNMAGAWLGLGQTMILQKQISKGLEYMEKAAKITPRNARVWLSLLQAYRLKGDAAKANIAAEQLNKFYKAEKATVEEQDAAKEQKKPIRKPEQQPESSMELPANLKK
jgi:tetratricopeptide (TPR) repeat protein